MKKAISFILTVFCVFCQMAPVCACASGQDTAQVKLPIMMYHEVKPTGSGKDAILPEEFEADLKFMAENGYTAVTMSDVIAFVCSGAPLPEKPIVLTFDDGYLNNYIYVLPLIKEYDTKIVFSIIGRNTDDFTCYPSDNIDYAHVTWQQLFDMASSGLVEVQNHSYDLHSMSDARTGCCPAKGESGSDYEVLLMSDTEKLQGELFDVIGRVPNTFAYPYGAYCRLSETVLREELGFCATLSCEYGLNTLSVGDVDSLFGMKRIARAHGHSLQQMLSQIGLY